MKIELKNKRLAKIGDSFGFIVDRAYVNNGQLVLNETYKLSIEKGADEDVIL